MNEETILDLLRLTNHPDDILISFKSIIDDHHLQQGPLKLYNFLHEVIPTFSRRQLRSVFDRKVSIRVNDECMGSTDEYFRLNLGDIVTLQLSMREFLENTPEFVNLGILYTDPLVCAIEKPSNINCVESSLFEYSYRLKCWDGAYYDSCECLYRLPKHGSGIMLITKDISTLQDIYSQFYVNNELNYLKMTCVTSSSHRQSPIPVTITDPGFETIQSLTIRAERTIESKSYGFVSILSVTPKLSSKASAAELRTTREFLSLDLKRIKHVLKRFNLTIIGLDNVGKQGKGVFSVWNNVAFLPLSVAEVPKLPVNLCLPLPGKFLKFLEKESYYMKIQSQKFHTFTDNRSVDNSARSEHELEKNCLQRPIEYQLGYAKFCDLNFQVNENVLIPRPSSETLVVAAMKCAELIVGDKNKLKALNILDLGTGSGSLIIALIHKLRRQYNSLFLSGYGVDISTTALQVAETNARTFGFEDVVRFGYGKFEDPSTWLPSNTDNFLGYDIIICNPPYSAPSEKRRLALSSRMYEPEVAIYADNVDPLMAYRILRQSLSQISSETGEPSLQRLISRKVFFISEIGAGQLLSVSEIFHVPLEKWKVFSIEKDHKGIDRAIVLFYE